MCMLGISTQGLRLAEQVIFPSELSPQLVILKWIMTLDVR